MPSFNLAVPFVAKQVRIVPSPVQPEGEKSGSDAGYAAGFDAGYRAGLLQASLEARRRQQQDSRSLQQSLEALANAKSEIIQSLGCQLPPLLLETFKRLLAGHQFTAEEVGVTVATFIRQLEDARELAIECAPTLLGEVQSFVERMGLTLATEKISWKANPDLKPGEFRIQSTLGSVDGRHAPLIAQLQEQLDSNFPKEEES